jgi:S-adenosylmethionine-diacylglycerol 3-amino-3-carboxypropyl transferase
MNAEPLELVQDSEALLGRAVHRHRTFTLGGVQERLFTWAFRDLVYPQIWEDPRVDLAAMELDASSRVVTIASGGCNVLNYLTAGPARIHAVDLNHAHVALNRLKHAAIRHFEAHETFMRFFGSAASPENVLTFDAELSPRLDDATRAYWNRRTISGRRNIELFANGFYRAGLLGRFITVAHWIARAYGRDPRRMLAAHTRAEQISLFEAELAPLFDRPFLRCVLGHRAALYGLGIPPAQYSELLGNAQHMADVVRERLRRLACDFDLTDNYFAWQAFARGYATDGFGPLPPYLQSGQFRCLKGNIDRVSVEQASYTDFLARQPAASFDRYILLDAQDWMDDRALAHLWNEITRTAAPRARVIFRTAGRNTILPGRVPDWILNRWRYEHDRSDDLLAQDRSAIYGGFHLYGLAA